MDQVVSVLEMTRVSKQAEHITQAPEVKHPRLTLSLWLGESEREVEAEKMKRSKDSLV